MMIEIDAVLAGIKPRRPEGSPVSDAVVRRRRADRETRVTRVGDRTVPTRELEYLAWAVRRMPRGTDIRATVGVFRLEVRWTRPDGTRGFRAIPTGETN